MSKRRRAPHLGGRNHSIRLTPFPTARRKTLQSFPQLRRAHRINVDAHVLCEKTCKCLQKPAFEIAVNALKRLNHQGKTNDEAHRRLRVAVYQSLHIVELALAKKQHIAASSEKSIDTTKQIGDLRHRFVPRERSSRQAKKASRCRFCFTQLLLKLLNSRAQQSHVNLRVSWIPVAKISRGKHYRLLVENLGRGNCGALRGEKYSLGESSTHQMG